MREILFRGKSIQYPNEGKWIYGYYVHNRYPLVDHMEHRIFTGLPDGPRMQCIDVDPSTIGQYTGLKDRKGVRIFEGDIIKTHYANTPKADFIEQVVFHNGRFCGMYERDKMKMWATLPDGIKHLPMDKSVYMEWCEIVGNIHDNPELLEG